MQQYSRCLLKQVNSEEIFFFHKTIRQDDRFSYKGNCSIGPWLYFLIRLFYCVKLLNVLVSDEWQPSRSLLTKW